MASFKEKPLAQGACANVRADLRTKEKLHFAGAGGVIIAFLFRVRALVEVGRV